MSEELPAAFWRWRCPCGAGGAYNSAAESDQGADLHMQATGHRGVSMHTAGSPNPWTGQTTLGGSSA